MEDMAPETDFAKEFENCRKRCLELEEKSKRYETRFLILEIEVENLKKKNQELEAKITMIQKIAVDTINVVSDSEDEKTMIKNKGLSPSTPGVAQSAFRGVIDISDEDVNRNEISNIEKVSGASKIGNLKHMDEEHMDDLKFHSRNTRSTKPKCAAKIITSDVESSDEDVNHNEIPNVEKVSGTSKSGNLGRIDKEHVVDLKFHSMSTRSTKRKRAAKIITSDEEGGDEDLNHKEIPNVEKVLGLSKSGTLEHIEDEHTDDLKFHSSNTRSTKRKRAARIITSDEEGGDEDLNHNEIPNVEKVLGSSKSGTLEHIDDEHTDDLKFHSMNTRSTKRKRAARIITSDDEISDEEDDYDDNAPISTLIKQHSSTVKTDSEEEIEEYASKRHLRRLRKSKPENKQDNSSSSDSIQTPSLNEDADDSEDESSDGFIDDRSECESVSDRDSPTDDSKEEAEKLLNKFKKSLEKIRRKKSSDSKWESEADMLADFGKYPELCMRAVCALYRQQTDDEKECKVTIHHNERGFSQPDAHRGSELAEFLTDGDSGGDVTKTLEELEEYNPDGIELCTHLAIKYSKQLFEIYKNNEDPYFGPKW